MPFTLIIASLEISVPVSVLTYNKSCCWTYHLPTWCSSGSQCLHNKIQYIITHHLPGTKAHSCFCTLFTLSPRSGLPLPTHHPWHCFEDETQMAPFLWSCHDLLALPLSIPSKVFPSLGLGSAQLWQGTRRTPLHFFITRQALSSLAAAWEQVARQTSIVTWVYGYSITACRVRIYCD